MFRNSLHKAAFIYIAGNLARENLEMRVRKRANFIFIQTIKTAINHHRRVKRFRYANNYASFVNSSKSFLNPCAQVVLRY